MLCHWSLLLLHACKALAAAWCRPGGVWVWRVVAKAGQSKGQPKARARVHYTVCRARADLRVRVRVIVAYTFLLGRQRQRAGRHRCRAAVVMHNTHDE